MSRSETAQVCVVLALAIIAGRVLGALLFGEPETAVTILTDDFECTSARLVDVEIVNKGATEQREICDQFTRKGR